MSLYCGVFRRRHLMDRLPFSVLLLHLSCCHLCVSKRPRAEKNGTGGGGPANLFSGVLMTSDSITALGLGPASRRSIMRRSRSCRDPQQIEYPFNVDFYVLIVLFANDKAVAVAADIGERPEAAVNVVWGEGFDNDGARRRKCAVR